MASGTHGMFQAGTGTGKSFALLIPAILSGTRTVVATFNKALQNQYVRDLMFLDDNLGTDFRWAILKGRGNYPCLAKINDLTRGALTTAQRAVVDRVEADVAAKEEVVKIADREDFPALDDEAWKPFSMSAAECPGANSCPFGDKCLAEGAKARAGAAQIVVTNTAYLMQDLILRQQTAGSVALLGDFGQLIVDEAHTLPDVATGALADTMGEGTYRVLARDMAGYMDRNGGAPATAEKVEQAAAALWTVLRFRFDDFAEKTRNRKDPMPLTHEMLLDLDDLGGFFSALHNAIYAAREEIKATRPDSFDDREKIARERHAAAHGQHDGPDPRLRHRPGGEDGPLGRDRYRHPARRKARVPVPAVRAGQRGPVPALGAVGPGADHHVQRDAGCRRRLLAADGDARARRDGDDDLRRRVAVRLPAAGETVRARQGRAEPQGEPGSRGAPGRRRSVTTW